MSEKREATTAGSRLVSKAYGSEATGPTLPSEVVDLVGDFHGVNALVASPRRRCPECLGDNARIVDPFEMCNGCLQRQWENRKVIV